MAELRRRATEIKTMQGACEILLTQKGKTVRLEGAVVAKFPAEIRVRAWKMGSAVFDAAMRDGSVYVFDATGEGEVGSTMAHALADLLQLLGTSFVEHAQLDASGVTLVLRGAFSDGRTVTCDVDRSTLAVQRFVLAEDLEISLHDHRAFGDTIWATRSVFRTPSGAIEVRYTDVALNVDISESASAPPVRARLVR